MVYVDANFFLSFFIDRNSSQHQIAKKLFYQASIGKVKIYTSTLVIFEVYWTIKSFYQLKADQNKKIIYNILNLPSLKVENKSLILQSLDNFSSYSFGLEDCYHLAFTFSTLGKDLATFDKKLKKKFILFSPNGQKS